MIDRSWHERSMTLAVFNVGVGIEEFLHLSRSNWKMAFESKMCNWLKSAAELTIQHFLPSSAGDVSNTVNFCSGFLQREIFL